MPYWREVHDQGAAPVQSSFESSAVRSNSRRKMFSTERVLEDLNGRRHGLACALSEFSRCAKQRMRGMTLASTGHSASCSSFWWGVSWVMKPHWEAMNKVNAVRAKPIRWRFGDHVFWGGAQGRQHIKGVTSLGRATPPCEAGSCFLCAPSEGVPLFGSCAQAGHWFAELFVFTLGLRGPTSAWCRILSGDP